MRLHFVVVFLTLNVSVVLYTGTHVGTNDTDLMSEKERPVLRIWLGFFLTPSPPPPPPPLGFLEFAPIWAGGGEGGEGRGRRGGTPCRRINIWAPTWRRRRTTGFVIDLSALLLTGTRLVLGRFVVLGVSTDETQNAFGLGWPPQKGVL